MFQYLREAGYYIKWMGKNDALTPDALASSVDDWKDFTNFDEVQEFIDNAPQQPYVLFLPTLGAHPQYKCNDDGISFDIDEAGYYSFWNNSTSMYDIDELRSKAPLRKSVAEGTKNKPDYWENIPKFRNLTSLSEDFFLGLNACYLHMVTNVDTLLGKIINAVDLDNTVIVTSADHGDFAGDAQLVEKVRICDEHTKGAK